MAATGTIGGTFVQGLACRECGATYPAEARSACEACFGPLEVRYDVNAQRAVLSREAVAAGPPANSAMRAVEPAGGRAISLCTATTTRDRGHESSDRMVQALKL